MGGDLGGRGERGRVGYMGIGNSRYRDIWDRQVALWDREVVGRAMWGAMWGAGMGGHGDDSARWMRDAP